MACISKIGWAIEYDCQNGYASIDSALIINRSDIESYEIIDFEITALTLKVGATAFKVDTVKKSVTVVETLRVNEGAPNAFHQEVKLTVYDKANAILANALSNADAVVLYKANKNAKAAGIRYGLKATSSEYDAHNNGGWTTFVLSTPENVVGEAKTTVSEVLYDNLYKTAM